ncbi:RNA 2',3'-cyclic phosphodiesterase [uncultured Brachyspira sp.]|uniref:RNA 2',3'-cyclic phosphodiesterase n=1 Tax=uncultured Brachyspira sp. TaxID=221953 RepID=UPI0026292B13|nr:RNA 2',3'-cyclic phosphodiesterase [uncultured Brachyspira sp.]
MRAFLALNLNEEIKNKYSNILNINKNTAELKKVSKDKIHITLVFFDYIKDKQIEQIKEKVINSSPAPFNINLKNISYFTNKFKDINIIFINALRESLNDIENLKYDKKDFKSHITLARVKKVYDNEKLKENIERIYFTPLIFLADSITLYSSDFHNYTEIFTINF